MACFPNNNAVSIHTAFCIYGISLIFKLISCYTWKCAHWAKKILTPARRQISVFWNRDVPTADNWKYVKYISMSACLILFTLIRWFAGLLQLISFSKLVLGKKKIFTPSMTTIISLTSFYIVNNIEDFWHVRISARTFYNKEWIRSSFNVVVPTAITQNRISTTTSYKFGYELKISISVYVTIEPVICCFYQDIKTIWGVTSKSDARTVTGVLYDSIII